MALIFFLEGGPMATKTILLIVIFILLFINIFLFLLINFLSDGTLYYDDSTRKTRYLFLVDDLDRISEKRVIILSVKRERIKDIATDEYLNNLKDDNKQA